MTGLGPVDRERNREVLAARLGWPDGAVDNCREIEAGFPRWHVWYEASAVPGRPYPAYGAATVRNRHGDPVVYAPTAGDMTERLAEADRRLAAEGWL